MPPSGHPIIALNYHVKQHVSSFADVDASSATASVIEVDVAGVAVFKFL